MKPKTARPARSLVVNIGNTTLLAAVCEGTRILRRLRVPSSAPLAEARAALQNLLGKKQVTHAAFCSVVPALTPPLASLLGELTGVPVLQLKASAPHGLHIAYKDPSRLGTDRLAAILGARVLHPRKRLVVIDCGTASTLTALDADGTLCGGAILPGLGLWAEALGTRTAQLPTLLPRRPRRATGRSPEEAITSGLYHGHLGALERLCTQIAAECFGSANFLVLATGGNAKLFRREKLFTRIEPDLILVGLSAFATISQHDA